MLTRYKVRLFWLGCIIFSIFSSCTSQAALPTPTEPSPTIPPTPDRMEMIPISSRPDYIEHVSPEEYSVIPLTLYNDQVEEAIHILGHGTPETGFRSNICISLELGPLVQIGDVFVEAEKVEERIELFVNKQAQALFREESYYGLVEGFKVEDATTRWMTPLVECWKVPLDAGRHEVTFKFHQTSGDIQEYAWYFEIVE